MNKTERNEDREVTFAMVGFVLIFLFVVVMSRWILPKFGLGTWMTGNLSVESGSNDAPATILPEGQEKFKINR